MSQPKLNEAQSIYLDLARALAAMAVLVGHSATIFLDGSFLRDMHLGPSGVIIFFLLSGFLISYSALRKYNDKSYGFSSYFIDRFARIYTAFIPALVFVLIVDYYTLSLPLVITPERLADLSRIQEMRGNYNIQTWVGSLFMLQGFPLFQVARLAGIPNNPWFIAQFGSAAPFWTINIEWWIYMVFGAVAIMHVRDRHRFKLWQLALLAFAAITPTYFLVGGTYNCLTLLWIIGMLGCLVFLNLSKWLAASRWPVSSRGFTRCCVLLFIASLVAMVGRALDIKLDTGAVDYNELQFCIFAAIGLFALLFALGSVKKVPAILAKIINFVAGYSFSLYLTHATVLVLLYVKYPGHDSDPAFFWLAIGVSNIVAIIFWWLFERHYHRVGEWIKRRCGLKQPSAA